MAGIAETTRLLGALKDRYLAPAIGPRQKALLELVIDRRLDRAGGDLGRIAERARGRQATAVRTSGAAFLPEQRPSSRQSELDYGTGRPDFVPQVAFKNGKEVSSRTGGSVRPDGVSADRRSASFEIKNHNINTNADGLIYKVTRQVLERAQHLPPSMQQHIAIDVRGQQVSTEQLNDIARRIVQRSNGLLRREHIEFMGKD